MSTSPENHIVNLLSHWLARHVDNAELLRELDALDRSALAPAQAEAVQELRQELTSKNGRGDLEMAVRETLEAVALG
jgi:hypothetical protein